MKPINVRAWDIASTWTDIESDDDARIADYLERVSLCASLPIPMPEAA